MKIQNSASTVVRKVPDSNSEIPYFEKEAICPICGQAATHRYLRDQSYQIINIEPDNFISEYKWVKPGYARFDLYSFFFWHCSICGYTDDHLTYLKRKEKEPAYKLEEFRKKFWEASEKDPVLEKLKNAVTYPVANFIDNLNLHLLGLYVQFIPGEYQRDVEKIARFALRVSWLYRRAATGNKGATIEVDTREFFEHFEVMQSNLMNTLNSLESLKEWIDVNLNSLPAESRADSWQKVSEEFSEIYRGMAAGIDQMMEKSIRLPVLGKQIENFTLYSEDNPLNFPFREHESYLMFLQDVKNLWKELPVSENQALEMSLSYFKEMVNSHIFDDNQMKLAKAYELVVYLFYRLKKYRQGLDYAERMEKLLRHMQQMATKRLQSLKVIKDDTQDPAKIKRYLARTRRMAKTNREMASRIKKAKLAVDEKKAREIFIRERALPTEELRQKLKEADLEPEVIKRVLEIHQKEKKKGILQIFKF